MTILVTGGLGYIGSHTVVELLNNNFDVVIVDDLSNSERFILENIEKVAGKKPVFYPFDLRRKELLSQVFDAHDIGGCINFAAFKAVGESQEKPVDYYENNLFSLINILQEFKTRNISNFIFSSSCTVYGQADEMPIDEETPLKLPESSYGNSAGTDMRNRQKFCGRGIECGKEQLYLHGSRSEPFRVSPLHRK